MSTSCCFSKDWNTRFFHVHTNQLWVPIVGGPIWHHNYCSYSFSVYLWNCLTYYTRDLSKQFYWCPTLKEDPKLNHSWKTNHKISDGGLEARYTPAWVYGRTLVEGKGAKLKKFGPFTSGRQINRLKQKKSGRLIYIECKFESVLFSYALKWSFMKIDFQNSIRRLSFLCRLPDIKMACVNPWILNRGKGM